MMSGSLRSLLRSCRNVQLSGSKNPISTNPGNRLTRKGFSSKRIGGSRYNGLKPPTHASTSLRHDGSCVIEHRHWIERLRTLLHHFNRGKATMSDNSIPQTSEACCQIPPVQSGYAPVGETTALADYKEVYIIGPKDSKTAVIALFDIFGFYPQTKYGADIIAEALNARVYMPDVFFGDPLPLDTFPLDTDEKKKRLGDFFQNQAAFSRVTPGLLNLAKTLRGEGVTTLYFYGLCWGGKVAALVGSETYDDDGQTRPVFDAVGALHPAMLSAPDAEKLVVPIAVYASKDEPLDEYKKMVENLGQKPFASKNAYRVYPTMHHGWGGARADLENLDNKEQFSDVYARLATFFKNATEK